VFQGGLIDPGTGRSNYFRGAVLQKRNAGYGYFKGTNQTGAVLLQAAP
jgi:hypothetical protein